MSESTKPETGIIEIPITWTCHICKRERPDEKISVYRSDISVDFGLSQNLVHQNVRYCNDNQQCIEKVKTFRFITVKKPFI